MASFNIARLTRQILVVVVAFLVLVYASPPLGKRATQVSLITYTFQNNVLAGSINV
jgi:hypothetical protein